MKHMYTLATILFVVGGLLLYQGNETGVIAICIGLFINVFYRLNGLSKNSLKNLVFLELLKLASAVFLTVTVVMFFIDRDALQYVIVAMIFDLIVNISIFPTTKK